MVQASDSPKNLSKIFKVFSININGVVLRIGNGLMSKRISQIETKHLPYPLFVSSVQCRTCFSVSIEASGKDISKATLYVPTNNSSSRASGTASNGSDPSGFQPSTLSLYRVLTTASELSCRVSCMFCFLKSRHHDTVNPLLSLFFQDVTNVVGIMFEASIDRTKEPQPLYGDSIIDSFFNVLTSPYISNSHLTKFDHTHDCSETSQSGSFEVSLFSSIFMHTFQHFTILM